MDDVLVIGEALVDIVSAGDGPPVEHPGGSPANVALGLARLGRRTSLLTRIGDDGRGAAVRQHLESSGVRLVDGSVTAGATSTAEAVIDARGVAQYRFDVHWEVPGRVDTSGAGAVHTGSIAAFLQPGGDTVIDVVEAAAGHRVVTYDPNVRPQFMGDPADARARIERIVAAADVVKVSDEDLAWLAPGEPVQDVAEQWLGLGPGIVVVTRGGDGALGVTRGTTLAVPSPQVDVVDTVGAGDAFMAGLLDALAAAGLLAPGRSAELRGLGPDLLADMLVHAGRVAAFTCTRKGAQPPTRADLDAWAP